MVGHGGSSAGSYLADPTSPIPSHCASIVVTSTLRVKCVPEWFVHCVLLCVIFVCLSLKGKFDGIPSIPHSSSGPKLLLVLLALFCIVLLRN